MADKETPDNVIHIVRNDNEAKGAAETTIPMNKYKITDINSEQKTAVGFLVFTSQHVAIMKDTGDGAIPVLVYPLERVAFAEAVDDDQHELPW